MCVIMVKEQNILFPEERILKNCWDNNPDMGGFMYAWNGQVHIRKGFMTFEDFKRALEETRKKTGDKIPYVLHFRISTQGYDKSCCQPFPLSSKMHNLKKLRTSSNIGVAHNGVLSITSDGSKEYSDTMKFITDYLTNIIRGFDWHEDKRTVKLIENLIKGSRFAIMDKNGHIEMRGNGWVKDNESGCYFSNSTYSYKKYVYKGHNSLYDYDDWGDYSYCGGAWNSDYRNAWSSWKEDKVKEIVEDVKSHAKKEKKSINGLWQSPKEDAIESYLEEKKVDYFEKEDGLYNFNEETCPHAKYDDDNYCDHSLCKNFHNCSYVKECMGEMCDDVINRIEDIDNLDDFEDYDDAYGLRSARA